MQQLLCTTKAKQDSPKQNPAYRNQIPAPCKAQPQQGSPRANVYLITYELSGNTLGARNMTSPTSDCKRRNPKGLRNCPTCDSSASSAFCSSSSMDACCAIAATAAGAAVLLNPRTGYQLLMAKPLLVLNLLLLHRMALLLLWLLLASGCCTGCGSVGTLLLQGINEEPCCHSACNRVCLELLWRHAALCCCCCCCVSHSCHEWHG